MAGSAEVTVNQLTALIRQCLGKPYQYGATGPDAFDCSGLIYYNCHRAGITSCPRTSEEQFTWVQRVSRPQMGDLVFFVGAEGDPPPGHVGYCLNASQMIDAPHTGTNVQINSFGIPGIGVSKVMGFGRIPRTISTSAPSSTMPQQQNDLAAAGVAGGIADIIVGGAFILIAIAVVIFVGMLVL